MKDIEAYKNTLNKITSKAIGNLMEYIGEEALTKAKADSMKTKHGWAPKKNNWGSVPFANPSQRRSTPDETPANQTGNLIKKTDYLIKKNSLTYVVNTPYAKALEEGHTINSSINRKKWVGGKPKENFNVLGRPYLSTIVKNSLFDAKKKRVLKEEVLDAIRNYGF